jgi:cytochrome c biogenesis protein
LSTAKRGFLQSLWDFFCSLKLSISLLIALAVTSIIGTIVKQNGSIEEYLREYSESTIRIFNTLGFFDMYHSWWFILLLYLLTVNLIACSIKRLPRVWKIVSEPVVVLDDGLEKSLTNLHEAKLTEGAESAKGKLAGFLTANFAAPTVTETDGEIHLFSQKSPYCRLGVYVVHLSIIIIFIGAMIGSLFGYKAYVQIPEGSGTSYVYKTTGKGEQLDLGFTVRCDKFSVAFYDTGAPKEFRSILSVVDGGKTVIDKRPVIVNDPLTYNGITFYQSSYGPAGDPIYRITVTDRKSGQATRLALREGELAGLPSGGSVRIIAAASEVGHDFPSCAGPGVRVEISQPNGKSEFAIALLNDSCKNFDEQRGGAQIITFDALDAKYYTGLQVAKDPGVWIVWTGCALMVLGICMAFFMSHRRIWIRIGRGKIVMGGTASKNQAGFSLFFDDLVEKLKKQ